MNDLTTEHTINTLCTQIPQQVITLCLGSQVIPSADYHFWAVNYN